MKIVLCLNVLNEEKNIGRILSAYNSWVDHTFIVDGGCTDKTIKLAMKFNNVSSTYYPALSEITPGSGNYLNNITRHVEKLVDVATNFYGADWIIYDDCDCVPNYALKENGRHYLETTEFDTVFVPRLYLYGIDQHFPGMVLDKNGNYVPSLWAWKTSFKLQLKESIRHLTITNLPESEDRLNLYPPYCLLHYFAPDEITIQRKMEMQRLLVGHEVQHPLQFGGKLETLPEWARE